MKVLAVYGAVPGVRHYRGIQQLATLSGDIYSADNTYGIDGVTEVKGWLDWVFKNKPDAIHIIYNSHLETCLSMEIIHDEFGIPIILDCDDNVYSIPGTNQAADEAHHMSRPQRIWADMFKVATAITTTTPTLRDALRADKPCYIVPNFADPKFYDGPRLVHDDIRIVFTGAAGGRWGEFQYLDPLVTWLGETYPQVKVVVLGYLPAQWLDHKHVYVVRWCDVPMYFSLLNHLAPDIGLAPLVPHDFNRCKSVIKYYEYAMAGAAGIYSDLEPYHEVRHGDTGLVVPHDVDAWKDALTTLIESATMREEIAGAGKADVQANHTSSDALERVLKEVIHGSSS